MPNVFDADEAEITAAFDLKPEVVAPVSAIPAPTVASAPAVQKVVEGGSAVVVLPATAAVPVVTAPLATPTEVIASLSEIVQSLGKDDILTVGGKKVKAADIRAAIEDHQNKQRWQAAQGERDRQIGEERKRYQTFIPLIERLESDEDFAGMIQRAEELYDNPELIRKPAIAPISSGTPNIDLFGDEPVTREPTESVLGLAEMTKKVQAIEDNQLLIARRDKMLEKEQGREQLALLKQEVASYAKENDIKWDGEREEKFLAYVGALSQGNHPDEKVAQEAFFLVTREDRDAKIAATAADNAVAAERKGMPGPPPTLSGSGRATPTVSLSPREVEIFEALNIPSDRWAAVAAT